MACTMKEVQQVKNTGMYNDDMKWKKKHISTPFLFYLPCGFMMVKLAYTHTMYRERTNANQ